MKYVNRTYLLLAAVFIFSFTFFIVFPLAKLGTSHLRVIEAINTDESDLLWLIIQAFRNGTFDLGSSPYGILYYNICLGLSYVLSWFTHVNDTHIIIITRLVSYTALLGSSALIAKYVQHFKLGNWLVVFFLSLAGSLTLIRYGLMLHPDILQLFFISGGLFCVSFYLENDKLKWFFLSVVCAGLAFSSKYSGLILLPLIVISVLLKYNRVKDKLPIKASILINLLGSTLVFIVIQLFEQTSFIVYINSVAWLAFVLLAGIIVSALVFIFHISALFNKKLIEKDWFSLVAFLITLSFLVGTLFFITFSIAAPQGMVNLQFFTSFLTMTGDHVDGHWFRNDTGFIGWIQALVNARVVKPLWLVLFILGFSLLLKKNFQNKSSWFNPHLLPSYWIFTYLLVITFGVSSKFEHYLIPVIPFFFIYIAYLISSLTDYVSKRVGWLTNSNMGLGISLLFGCTLLIQSFSYKNKKIESFESSSRIAAGNWLDENVIEDVFILADKYTYVPARAHFHYTAYWGISTALIEEFNPDYIVIQNDVYTSFLDSSRVNEYLHGRELFLDRSRLYNDLLSNSHSTYELAKDFKKTKVYKRKYTRKENDPYVTN